MALTRERSPEREAGLKARAQARGLSLGDYLQEIVSNRAESLDWSLCPAAESIPGKVSGAWVLKGTRMPVAAIFENLEAGASIDNILEWYDGLDLERVKAVIEFAARSLDRPPALSR